MTPREVRDADGTVWSCVQSLAGLGEGPPPDTDGPATVVCTPGGGAPSVRVEMASGWAGEASDEDILAAIRAAGG